MVDGPRLILFPGLGADRRLFDAQERAGLRFEVPEMPIPQDGQDFADYARTLGRSLGLDENCVVGGVSFGGMLAYQLAATCGAKALILLASCTDPSAIPRHYRWVELTARLIPDHFIHRRAALGARCLAKLERLGPDASDLVQDMARKASMPFLRRTGRMILRWKPGRRPECPIYALHGTADRVIPIRRVTPTEVLEGAGHLLCLTHPDVVTIFIEQSLASLEQDQSRVVASMAG